ncbi:hypothetical protein U9M48_013473 [Paspalum notatum var. saurae]|uniref:Uncharacterized protein n=1 Tax=Paspalum notatum var. saurae TaxID=547442 RepID=A0AAQ3SZA6_PASNO
MEGWCSICISSPIPCFPFLISIIKDCADAEEQSKYNCSSCYITTCLFGSASHWSWSATSLSFLLRSLKSMQYYLVVVDDFSHYSWTFPLRFKCEVFSTLSHFFARVSTRFGLTIKAVRCETGVSSITTPPAPSSSLVRSSPQENGKAERMIRTTNDVMRTLRASLPARFGGGDSRCSVHELHRPGRDDVGDIEGSGSLI